MNKVADHLKRAADLTQRAASLAAAGRFSEALALEDQADQLRSQARQAAEQIQEPTGAVGREGDGDRDRGPSTRKVTIASLNEIGVPTSPREVASYARARFDIDLSYRLLAALRRDERRAWASPRSHRPVYVVPALEGRHFLPMRGKLALSDWQLEQRLIGPWSERVDHLNATLSLARQLDWIQEAQPSDAALLSDLVRRYAATIPGVRNNGEDVRPAEIARAAEAELSALADEDRIWREAAAERGRAILSAEEQLWGAQPPTVVRQSVG